MTTKKNKLPEPETCEHCGFYSLTELVDGLCEDCQEKFDVPYNSDFIGYRKGE